MAFSDLIDRIMSEFRVSDGAELARRCGFSRSLISYWKEHPEAKPQPMVLSNIEAAFGIQFVPEGTRNPQDFVRSHQDSTTLPTKSVVQLPTDKDIPSSARDIYENVEFVGGKLEWLELSEEERSYLEGVYSLMVKQIDRANDEYENQLRELLAARESRVRKAVQECEETIERRMLRQFE